MHISLRNRLKPAIWQNVRRLAHAVRLLRYGGQAGVFRRYYRANQWGSLESVSGHGSTVQYTENIRLEIPLLLSKYQIKRILDAPCGDYNWFRLILRPADVLYVGGDIVREIVERNVRLFSNEKTHFLVLDITRDPLPEVDLWMCRDCLLHLSNAAIFRVITNFLTSPVEYFFASTYDECSSNQDTPTGGARPVNLERPPFSFPQPILKVADWIDGFPVRSMGLWSRKMLAEAVIGNEAAPRVLWDCAQKVLQGGKKED